MLLGRKKSKITKTVAAFGATLFLFFSAPKVDAAPRAQAKTIVITPTDQSQNVINAIEKLPKKQRKKVVAFLKTTQHMLNVLVNAPVMQDEQITIAARKKTARIIMRSILGVLKFVYANNTKRLLFICRNIRASYFSVYERVWYRMMLKTKENIMPHGMELPLHKTTGLKTNVEKINI